MVPLIYSKEPINLAPVNPSKLEKGDIVLAKVSGRRYTHKVSAVDHGKQRIQISNNHGGVNGWTSYDQVYGICTHVSGVERPSIQGKIK